MKERIKQLLPDGTVRRLGQVIGPFRDAACFAGASQSLGVAMIHAGRCGSSVLARLLGQHPLIEWDGELINRHRKGELRWHLQALSPMRMLRLRKGVASAPIYGFETKAHQDYDLRPGVLDMRLDEYLIRLQSLGFDRFIELRRENYLRRVVSGRVARKRRSFGTHRPTDAPAAPLLTIHLDPQRAGFSERRPLSLQQMFEELDTLSEHIRCFLAGKSLLRLSFEEDIQDDPRVAYRKVCDFLGIEVVEAEVTLRRTNPHPLCEVIENWNEVESYLAETPYAWMLEDKG